MTPLTPTIAQTAIPSRFVFNQCEGNSTFTEHPMLIPEFYFQEQQFDEDQDGKLSLLELRRCVRLIGDELPLEEAKVVVQTLDLDGDGLLSLEDFVNNERRRRKYEGIERNF